MLETKALRRSARLRGPVFPFARLPETIVDEVFLLVVNAPWVHCSEDRPYRRGRALTLIGRDYVDSGRRAMVCNLGTVSSRRGTKILRYLEAHPELVSHVRALRIDTYVVEGDAAGREDCLRILALGLRLDRCGLVMTAADLQRIAGHLAASGAGLAMADVSFSLMRRMGGTPAPSLPASLLRTLLDVVAPHLVSLETCNSPFGQTISGDLQLPNLPRLRRLLVYDLDYRAVKALIRASVGPVEVCATGDERIILDISPADAARIWQLDLMRCEGGRTMSATSWARLTALKHLCCTSSPSLTFSDASIAAFPRTLSKLEVEIVDPTTVNGPDDEWWSAGRLVHFLGDRQWLPALRALDFEDLNVAHDGTAIRELRRACRARGVEFTLRG